MSVDGAAGRVVAVVPAHDEENRVRAVAAGLVRRGLTVLVVDDGSADGTGARAADAGAQVLRLDPNRGKGGALKAGFEWALSGGCAAVLTLDADGQHDPEHVSTFLRVWSSTGADLVVGAREYRAMPPVRRLTNTLSRWLFSWAVGAPVADNQSGYRLYSRRLIEAVLASPEQGFAFEVDAIAICLARGYRLEWVPIATIYGEDAVTSGPGLT